MTVSSCCASLPVYFCGAWPRDSSIDVLEWLFAWPAFGISLDSCSLVIEPVGLFADVSVALLELVEAGADEVVDEVLDEPELSVVAVALEVVPVGALEVASLGVPVPVGLFGAAGSGGAADSLVDGVTGGVAVVVVELVVSVRLQPPTRAADSAKATARAAGLVMSSPGDGRTAGTVASPVRTVQR
jgi:hypothetical protein